MICFGCGDEYDPNTRETVIELVSVPDDPEEEETTVNTKKLRMFGKTLKLCPACTRACAIGITLNSQNLWLTEDLEFEEDEQDADISEDKPQDETV